MTYFLLFPAVFRVIERVHVRPAQLWAELLKQGCHHQGRPVPPAAMQGTSVRFIANQNGPHRASYTSARISGQEYVPYFQKQGQGCLCMPPALPISHTSAEDFSKGSNA